ncbi:LacI family DNA-binding transcriptional regulator [Streptomyces radicis]|uniref:LacI family transcriptional regulator n=1 Tax=Streptomyces radicis TaxID=1750517 RepID=A0A3A9WHD8_9ACTN|nr:LacI family DNA-binding transcriptional regulator [Streptomyces radicis]RKN12438.1 LacI family transcriptional regulator [Streptomyces radicis]RKN27792.1 LacI family transcriptional regulator [Streptomyces radicis]
MTTQNGGTGKASPGRTTLKDVAHRAGVSVPTVSRVIAGNYPVATATKRRVERALRELDYVANTHARALRGQGTKTVAFILNDVRGPSFAEVAHGIQEEATRRGRLCLVFVSGGDPRRELEAVGLMRQQGAEAVILIGSVHDDEVYRSRMAAIATSLDQSGSRLVLCGRPPLGDAVPTTVVEYDNEGGAHAITSRLLAAGHRRVLCFGGDAALTTSAERLAGYRRALADFGVAFDPGLVEKATFERGEAYLAMRQRLTRPVDFTAVFALTDAVAAGVLRALTEHGLGVPEDISLAGYDDVPPATDLRPRLTTVHVPYEELGRTAVRLALDRSPGADGPDQHALLGTHVVVRDSIGPPRHRA